jgi:ergothioneine biosynthesis protein EgtC
MCRFLVYSGREILLADLLTRPIHSLIRQSFDSRERSEPLNGDGFGVGWYAPQVDDRPCLFTSITPAWSNQNLHHLAEKITTPCVFAHVRAASPGMHVSEANCHPFQFGRYLWMHNGGIAQFPKIKRRVRESLRDELYDSVQGTTDSEHAFAVFLNHLVNPPGEYSPERLSEAMVETIMQLNAWTEQAGIAEPSYYNFAVTDGQSVVATRYVNDNAKEPASLYISSGAQFECREGVCRMLPAEQQEHAVIIASEPLTDAKEDWVKVPKNHLVMVTSQLNVSSVPLAPLMNKNNRNLVLSESWRHINTLQENKNVAL